MQILDTFLTFLADYRDAINTGVIIGFIAAIFASAIAAIIYLARWRNLLKLRTLNHDEEIQAGIAKGKADALDQRRIELIDVQNQ